MCEYFPFCSHTEYTPEILGALDLQEDHKQPSDIFLVKLALAFSLELLCVVGSRGPVQPFLGNHAHHLDGCVSWRFLGTDLIKVVFSLSVVLV